MHVVLETIPIAQKDFDSRFGRLHSLYTRVLFLYLLALTRVG